MKIKKSLFSVTFFLSLLLLCSCSYKKSSKVLTGLVEDWYCVLDAAGDIYDFTTEEEYFINCNVFFSEFEKYKNSNECYINSIINPNFNQAIKDMEEGVENLKQRNEEKDYIKIVPLHRLISQTMFTLISEEQLIDKKAAKASIFVFSSLIALIVILSISLFVYVTRFEKLRGEAKEMGYYSDFVFQGIQNERKRISRDVHDTVCQDLRAVRIETELLNIDNPDNKEKQKLIVDMLSKSIKDLREICNNLSPVGSKNEKQTSVWQSFVSSLNNMMENFTSKTGILCNVKIDPVIDAGNLTFYKSGNIFGIIQEAFTNIEKHSKATEASILIRNDERNHRKTILIFIIDNGIGFKEGPKIGLHFGMSNMKQRAMELDADFTVTSEPDDGTKIRLEVPVK